MVFPVMLLKNQLPFRPGHRTQFRQLAFDNIGSGKNITRKNQGLGTAADTQSAKHHRDIMLDGFLAQTHFKCDFLVSQSAQKAHQDSTMGRRKGGHQLVPVMRPILGRQGWKPPMAGQDLLQSPPNFRIRRGFGNVTRRAQCHGIANRKTIDIGRHYDHRNLRELASQKGEARQACAVRYVYVQTYKRCTALFPEKVTGICQCFRCNWFQYRTCRLHNFAKPRPQKRVAY